MTLNAIRQALLGHLTAHFTSAPLSMPNQDFRIPKGPWVRVELDLGETFGLEKGPGAVSFRRGVLRLLVYARAGTGQRETLAICQELEALFRLADLPDADGVLCGDPWTCPGEEEDALEGYDHQEVRAPWQALVEP